jgi:NADPH:quinone reductase-like Zn-dependent oxidoreductase
VRAYVVKAFGQQELIDVPIPTPDADEVLVKVRATSINPYDWHIFLGEPRVARVMPNGIGLRRPKLTTLGCDVAGTVEAVGRDVTAFRPGDEVYTLIREGGFAEYVTVGQDLLTFKPKIVGYEESAAVPMAAVTAMAALRDVGRLEAGQNVLVNGASGGVGSFAVQIAKAYGAKVTGVCGPRNVDLVRSLGADEVFNYRAEDFTRSGQRYDLMLDIAGGRPIGACRKVLEEKGTLVSVGGPAGRWIQPVGQVLSTMIRGPFVSQRMAMASVVAGQSKKQHLDTVAGLIDAGQVRPVIDRRYGFEEIPAALAYQQQGHSAGKVVVTVNPA